MVLGFFAEPSTIPAELHHIINEDMIAAYFTALTQVDDPDTHLRAEPHEHHSILVSSTDLVLLLELVFQNQWREALNRLLVRLSHPRPHS